MKKRNSVFVFAALLALAPFAPGALAQEGTTGKPSVSPVSERPLETEKFYIPESSKQKGLGFAHTNYVIRSVDGKKPAALKSTPAPLVNPDGSAYFAETPASLGCLYVFSPTYAGCAPAGLGQQGGPSAYGYGAIALVDAYDNPDAASDLSTFDQEFGLAAPPKFTKLLATGNGSCKTVPPNGGWSVEESLDIEWAHVFAPKAEIVLVEACSSSFTDLIYAESVAFNYIVDNYQGIGGQVSNSYGGEEFSGEIADDPSFADFTYNSSTGHTTHILAFASAGDNGYLGDSGTAGYPTSNPWLVSAGGTGILRNASTGAYGYEACWSGSGGGPSSYETYVTTWTGGNIGPWANFQYPIYGQGTSSSPSVRHTPDLAFDANPNSGVYVYNQYDVGGWEVVGGTSLASPALASIANRSGNRLGSIFLTPVTDGSDSYTSGENNLLYSQLPAADDYRRNFYDVTTGSNGTGSSAVVSYDQCTGVGSPRGIAGH